MHVYLDKVESINLDKRKYYYHHYCPVQVFIMEFLVIFMDYINI
jgi:hypothetical protein